MTAGRLHGSALTSRSSAAGRTVRGKVHTLVFTPMQLTAFPDTFIFLTQYTSQVFWAMQYFIKAFILLHMLSFQDIKLLFRCTCMSGSACAAFPPNLPAIVGLSRRGPESQSLSERLVMVEACNAHLTFFGGGGFSEVKISRRIASPLIYFIKVRKHCLRWARLVLQKAFCSTRQWRLN